MVIRVGTTKHLTNFVYIYVVGYLLSSSYDSFGIEQENTTNPKITAQPSSDFVVWISLNSTFVEIVGIWMLVTTEKCEHISEKNSH